MGDASELKEALVLKEPLVESAAEKPAPESMPRLSSTWKGALCWSGFITIWYLALQQLLTVLVPSVPSAREALLNWVPLHVYHYSEAAFAVATVLNLLNLVFEDSPDKQQLGLLSAVIKGLSWHSDHLIVTGRAVIKYDYHGALFLPSRYVQWSCSTPTMIFTLSRISSMDASSIAATMAADWLMVVTGYMASEMPWWAAVWPLAASFACMVYVLSQLKVMLGDALKEAGSEHARRCLRFTLGSTMVIWCLFPLGWVLSHCLAIPALAAWGEPMTMFANFSAKVVFSTSIMYNNFVTLAQRRKAARVAAEHSERIQAVHDLSVAVGRKDAFLEVVGHELRTPLNAICQLSAALAVGAGGPLGSQARDWMDTIKASAAHLLGVVNDILTFRAGQAAGLVIKQELVSVADVVDEVLRTLLPSAGNGILLEKVLHARLPPIVGDRRRLVLAITNLVANSIKFMDKANGKVTVKAYPDRGGRHVIIKVTDNGPGLTAKQLAQLGDAATLAQFDSGKRRAGGLGLGLPITFQLVAAHGGVVRMSSPGLGQGTCGLIRMPVLQAITDGALEKEFAEAYAAVGYSLEQLLSPELAASEGRACPTFGSPTAPTTATDTMHTHAPAWTAGAPSSNGGRRSSDGNRSSDGTRQVTTFVPSISPGLARALKSNASVNSTSSSFDMSQANVHTYQWCANTQSAYPPNDQAAHHADGGAEDAAIPGRPSEDSLAAWEAYAENMGYTLQPGQSGNLASASPSMNSSGSNALPVSTISAAAGRGVPGSAVALMSSLYVGSNPPSAAALRKPKNKPGVRPNRASNASSTRMSIEEGDEEGQEDEERPSVEVVGTPKRPSVTNYARHSEDAPLSTSVTSSAHSQLLSAAAAAAMASRMGSINPSVNMGQQDSAPVSSSLPALKGEASGPMYVEAPEWDEYLRTGDGDTGNSNSRMDSDAVVAANARLSLQYQKAVADAAATGGEVDAAWQSWVARIPEHHKVPGATKAAAPRPA